MHCISVVIIQNSGGSARCTVQIYPLSVQPCGYNERYKRTSLFNCSLYHKVWCQAVCRLMIHARRFKKVSSVSSLGMIHGTATHCYWQNAKADIFWRSGDGAETGWVHSFEIISILTENAIASASKMSQSCYILYILHESYKAIHHLPWITCCVACSLQQIKVYRTAQY